MNLMSFDSVQCERTRGQLDAYLSNELLVETTGEVLKHLESCADCSFELASRARVRVALRKAAATVAPPEDLQLAIQRRLRKAQPGLISGSPRSTWALAVAALALVIITAIAMQRWRNFEGRKQLAAAVLSLGVSDHLECAIHGHNYPDVAPAPERIREKIGAQYAGVLQVVEERLPGFQLLEGHICSVKGSQRKYIHFIARRRGTILSVILTRREGSSFPPGYLLKAGAAEGLDLYLAHLEGMHAAGFESKEYFGFVVSDLGQDEVLRITKGIAPPLLDVLDAGLNMTKGETSHEFRRSYGT